VLFHDPLGNCETQSGAAGRSIVGTPEPLEDPGEILGFDARTMVVYLEYCGAGSRPYLNLNRRPREAVSNGVVDEDGHKLAQAKRIARDRRRKRIQYHFHAALLAKRRQ
jgi:hypothetical protein